MHVTNSMRQQNQLRYFKNSGLQTSLQVVDIRYDTKKEENITLPSHRPKMLVSHKFVCEVSQLHLKFK